MTILIELTMSFSPILE